MLYICSARPRTSCSCRASSVPFCPYRPKNRPEERVTTGWIIFSKSFVVFSAGFVIFSKSFVVSQRQPADCFRRLKTLKLRVRNWMRSRYTIEFLGTWEIIHNPNFNVVEFDHFRISAGLPSFVLIAYEVLPEKASAGEVPAFFRLKMSRSEGLFVLLPEKGRGNRRRALPKRTFLPGFSRF